MACLHHRVKGSGLAALWRCFFQLPTALLPNAMGDTNCLQTQFIGGSYFIPMAEGGQMVALRNLIRAILYSWSTVSQVFPPSQAIITTGYPRPAP